MCPYSIGPDGTRSQSEGPEIFSPGQTGVEPVLNRFSLNRILARAPNCPYSIGAEHHPKPIRRTEDISPGTDGVEPVSNRLIGQMYVIGAAHCVSNRLIGQMYVIGAPHSAQHQSQRWKNSFFLILDVTPGASPAFGRRRSL